MVAGDESHYEHPKLEQQPDGGPEERPEPPPEGHRKPRAAGGLLRRSTASLVILVLVAAVITNQFDLGRKWLGWDYPSPVTEPAEVAPPPGLNLPDASPAPVVAEETEDQAADPDAVRRALAKLVASKKLGRHVRVAVDQLSDGASVYEHGVGLVTPASTMKMVTALAALETLGPDHRFATRVVAGANSRQVILVGGGDPLLGRAPVPGDVYPNRADVETLAAATAKSLQRLGRDSIRIRFDDSMFTGPKASRDWDPSYIPDNVVSPISALWVDGGRERTGLGDRSDDPAAAAAQVFADALAKEKITVLGKPKPAVAAEDATELAVVRSAPLQQIVQLTLEVSNNEAAEVLFRHVAIAEGQPASFAGGSKAVTAVLDRLGVDTSGQRILDGSGLSREDRLAPDTLLSVIGLAASDDHPELRTVVVDLPVAGFTGSLAYRFDTGDDAGPGRVRAKTGTLAGVHGLAGVVTDLDGTELSFVAIADRVKVSNTLTAQVLIDEIAAALAGCSCASST